MYFLIDDQRLPESPIHRSREVQRYVFGGFGREPAACSAQSQPDKPVSRDLNIGRHAVLEGYREVVPFYVQFVERGEPLPKLAVVLEQPLGGLLLGDGSAPSVAEQNDPHSVGLDHASVEHDSIGQ